jgi:putative drug exporter of the RND superfamily
MPLVLLRFLVTSRPGWVVACWVASAVVVGLCAPDLTRLAAEGQGNLLGRDAESLRAGEALRLAWPDRAYESLAVAALHRTGGLVEADISYAKRLVERIEGRGRPKAVLRVLGPDSPPEVAEQLLSRDGTAALVVVELSTSFVAPVTHEAVAWLQAQARAHGLVLPEGLEVRWTGDAMIGRDYMAGVQTSLNRAAVATVVLLLGVLLAVYRSAWLALIPLATIGTSLVISRSILAWMNLAGWELSPLVELFLVALLFGSGTDFCLFVSWRFGEHWEASDPARAMRVALDRSSPALLTSAGTVIVGLLLMGTTRFKLFSSTGPSVALGLAVTLAASLTMTPALLVILARHRPGAFAGLTAPSLGVWERVARASLRRPIACWLATVLVMTPLAVLGLRSGFVQDVMTEMPGSTISIRNLRWLATLFDVGALSPLTVVLDSDSDLRSSEGLALIDDVSRYLARQPRLREVRSATQPLGTTRPLEPARLSERLRAVNAGYLRMESGSRQLQDGLNEGAAKLRALLWIEARIAVLRPGGSDARREVLPANPKQAEARPLAPLEVSAWPARTQPAPSEGRVRANDPRSVMLFELTRAAVGAGQLAAGAAHARHEVSSILGDPVGRRALDRLLITPETVLEHPELRRSFAAYISPDGLRSRIDLTQADRIYSAAAMDQVETLRRRTNEFLGDVEGLRVTARLTGENSESADIRGLIHADQVQSWYVVPIGVFFVLILTIRDPLACLNLVATMVLSYAFALGATHLLFVTILGAAGIDWKVPYFTFVLLVAVGVDYNVFLMARVREESQLRDLRSRLTRAVGQTGGLITSAAAITACSFASFLFSPLASLRQLGFALVVGITIDALLVRPLLVPCGHLLIDRLRPWRQRSIPMPTKPPPADY